MARRIGALVGPMVRVMWVSTFHSMCARILRREAEAARLPAGFSIVRRGRRQAPGQALPGRAPPQQQAPRHGRRGGAAFGYHVLRIGVLLLPFMLILLLFGVAMGVFVSALIFRLGPSAEWLGWPIPLVLSIFAGVYYPVSTLPAALRAFARLIPPSYVFETCRAVLATGSRPADFGSKSSLAPFSPCSIFSRRPFSSSGFTEETWQPAVLRDSTRKRFEEIIPHTGKTTGRFDDGRFLPPSRRVIRKTGCHRCHEAERYGHPYPRDPQAGAVSSHAAGTRTSQSDRRVKTIVTMVWPAPFMTPFDINMIAKNM